jgi:hypothetical protein
MRAQAIVRPAATYVLGLGLLVLVLVGAGWVVTSSHVVTVFMLTAAAAIVALAMLQRGAFIGVFTLAAMNGIPLLDTSHMLAAHVAIQDAAVFILLCAAVAWMAADHGSARPTPLARALTWCGVALLLWCSFVAARTWAGGSAPLLGAIRFGRDFFYFALLLIVLPRVRLSARDLRVLLWLLGIGVCIFAVGQIAIVEGFARPTSLVHVASTGHTLGLTRVYAEMNDLLFAGLPVGIAALVLARGARAQWKAIPVTLLLGASFVVQLTRARWIALIASLVLVSLWLALQADRRVAVVLRRRLLMLLGGAAVVIAGIVVAAPGLISTGPLVTRLFSIFTDVSSQASTVAVRQHVASQMIALLGTHWPAGLGLIPPSAHYYSAFFDGSIRDPDVGVLNAVMTIGVIGALFIYLPLVVALVQCMRGARAGIIGRYPWLSYGGQIWIVAAIASSITLVTLFSVSGLVFAAVFLAALSQPLVFGTAREPAPDVANAAERVMRGDVPDARARRARSTRIPLPRALPRAPS